MDKTKVLIANDSLIRDNFRGDNERFAHFSAKNLIEIGLMGEKLD